VRTTRRARLLYEVAQGITAACVPDAETRSARLYRRALRGLDPDAARGLAGNREALRDAVGTRLGARGLAGLLTRHGHRLARGAALAALAIGLAIALVPPLHRAVFPPDLAYGKPWSASSAWSGFPQSGLMLETARPDGIFHTLEEFSPSVTVDLQAIETVHSVQVENRSNCCRERALPLAVELSTDGKIWQRVGYRRIVFATWTAVFPARPARFVRLRVDRPSVLHLRRVSVR
jgi:hypothetical protein